jgi:orotate phosphoribosyltransferase
LNDFDSARFDLIAHLKEHALFTAGPYTLRSGAVSDWYLDGRQTTFDGSGGRLVARCVLARLDPAVTAVGGMTMGADPIAVATAVCASRHLKSFSVRKEAKGHGIGGRIVGALRPADVAAVVEDTVTTGGAMAEAVTVLQDAGIHVAQAIVLLDRSEGRATARLGDLGVTLTTVLLPSDLGVQ